MKKPTPKAKPSKVRTQMTLGRYIEAAMSQAVLDAYAAGVSDPDKQRELMQAAREKAKAEFLGAN